LSVAKNEATDGLVKLFGRRYSYRQQNRRFSIAGLSEPFYYKKPDSRTRTTSYVEDLFGDSQSALAKAKLEFSIGAEAGDLKLNFYLLSAPKDADYYHSFTWLGRLPVDNPVLSGKTTHVRQIFESSINMYGSTGKSPFVPCLEVLGATELGLNHSDLSKHLPRLLTWCFRRTPMSMRTHSESLPDTTSFALYPEGFGYIPKEATLKDIMVYLTALDRLPNESETLELRKRIASRAKNDLDFGR